jgi:hypothetical protein
MPVLFPDLTAIAEGVVWLFEVPRRAPLLQVFPNVSVSKTRGMHYCHYRS